MPLSAARAQDDDYDDVALVRALADDDRRAPTVLWKRYAPTVFGILRRVIGPDPENEDLAQDVFFAVYRRAPTIRNGRALKAFIATVTVGTARHELRRRRVRGRSLRQVAADMNDRPTVAATVGAESREALPRLHRIIDRLRPEDRAAFELRFIEELTLTQVRTKLNVSLATAKRRIYRATRKVALRVERDPVLREYCAP